METYITPTIRKSESGKLSDYLDEEKSSSNHYSYRNQLSLEDLIAKDKVFILGEPGFGKSRLLIEMARHFSKISYVR